MKVHQTPCVAAFSIGVRAKKLSHLFLFLLTGMSFVLASAYAASAQSATAYAPANYTKNKIDSESIETLERRVSDLVNQERINNGRSPLEWCSQAAAAARSHSENMAEFRYFDHEDAQGHRVVDRAKAFGIGDWRGLGENIAYLSGYENPAVHVVEQWMRSKGHRENILESRYREGGIGLAITSDGKYFFTQVFVTRK